MNLSDSDSEGEAGRYVWAPNKRPRTDQSVTRSKVDQLVAEKVSAILNQRSALSQRGPLQTYTGKAEIVPLFDPENSDWSNPQLE
jgi:hypothetical protein